MVDLTECCLFLSQIAKNIHINQRSSLNLINSWPDSQNWRCLSWTTWISPAWHEQTVLQIDHSESWSWIDQGESVHELLQISLDIVWAREGLVLPIDDSEPRLYTLRTLERIYKLWDLIDQINSVLTTHLTSQTWTSARASLEFDQRIQTWFRNLNLSAES